MDSNTERESVDCLRCKTALRYAGLKQFREGTNWGIFGDLGELFEGHQEFEVYVCPNCRHVEFFAARPNDICV